MSFFNDLGRKISETGHGAVSKTKTIAETSKLNSAINDCKNRIEMTYREIGSFYVSKYGQNPDPEIAEKIKYVGELEESIKNMQDEVRRINGYIQCPRCGKTIRNDFVFCDCCGERLRNPETENRCAGCGAALNPGAAFCTKCGRPRDLPQEQPMNHFQGAVPPSPDMQPQNMQTMQGQAQFDFQNEISQPAQQSASDSYPEQTVQTGQTREKNEAPAGKICPACGYEMDGSQKFCLRCGEKL